MERLHADLGHDDPLVAALGELPVPIGKSGPLREKLFQGLSGLGTAGEFKSGAVILSETRDEGGKSRRRSRLVRRHEDRRSRTVSN